LAGVQVQPASDGLRSSESLNTVLGQIVTVPRYTDTTNFRVLHRIYPQVNCILWKAHRTDSLSTRLHLDDILPKDAQVVLEDLDWNPRKCATKLRRMLFCKIKSRRIQPYQLCGYYYYYRVLPSPQDTYRRRQPGGTPSCVLRQAPCTPSHFGTCRLLDSLVSTMANTVDQAIQDAVTKRQCCQGHIDPGRKNAGRH
jgi:hypothetical protein